MKVFPPNLSLWPFIAPKAEVPAMAASHFFNELILHDRIPSYLDRVGRSHTLPVFFLFGCLLLLPALFILLLPRYPERSSICCPLITGEEMIKSKGQKNDRHVHAHYPCVFKVISCDQHEHVYTTLLFTQQHTAFMGFMSVTQV